MNDYIESLMKLIIREHIKNTALVFKKNDWSLEVDTNGKIEGLLQTTLLTSNTLKTLIEKYFRYLEKKNIDLVDAYIINKEHFILYNLDKSYQNEIKTISSFLIQNYPDRLL